VVSSVQRGPLAARYGRGAPETVLHLRREVAHVAALQIGSYVRNELTSLPSGTARLATQAGVSRVQQVTAITEEIGERVVTFEDLGPIGLAIATAPTISLAAVGFAYSVTITNAAALAAAGSSVRVDVALTSGAAPAATEWVPLRLMTPAQLTSSPIASGTVTTAPTTLWARARSERDGFLPSAYSASASVAFAAIPGVTSLAATPFTGDGSRLTITWARATSDGAVFDVFVRLASQVQGTGVFAVTLPAGSTTATASGLVPSTLYTIDVRARAPFAVDQSTFSSTTATTDGTTLSLIAPTGVDASVPGSGVVAISGFLATAQRADAECQIATETAPGSGTFGAYVDAGTAPRQPDSSFFHVVAASADGLLRRLRARAVRTGATASAWVVAPTDVLPDASGSI
jgi:hypothetical protein